MCVLVLVKYMIYVPHTICVRIHIYDMCPHTHMMCPHTICVLILILNLCRKLTTKPLAYYCVCCTICVLILPYMLLYMCPHATICATAGAHLAVQRFS